jgi:hypothetical protein
MKKLLLILILGNTVWYTNVTASGKTEKRHSVGGAFNAAWQKIGDADASIYAGGVNYNSFTFFNDFPLGFYANVSMSFTNQYQYNDKARIFDIGFILNETIGAAFNLKCNEKIRIAGGLGLHFSELFLFSNFDGNELEQSDFSSGWGYWGLGIGYGVGTTIGVNIKLIKNVFFDFGSSFAYDFNGEAVNIDPNLSKSNVSALSIVPYAGICFSLEPEPIKPLIKINKNCIKE